MNFVQNRFRIAYEKGTKFRAKKSHFVQKRKTVAQANLLFRAVVNLTYNSINGVFFEITFTVPLTRKS